MIRKVILFSALFAAVYGITAHAEVGDAIGNVYATDILAYMDGAPIASYNIGGKTVIKAADLRDYGFEVTFDEEKRKADIVTVLRPDSLPQTAKTVNGNPGDIIGEYLETDIVCYLNGVYQETYNINGSTMLVTEDMGSMEKRTSRDGNIHSDIGYSAACIKTVWNDRERKVELSAIHPGDNITTDMGTYEIAGDRLNVIGGYFPMGYSLYKNPKEEPLITWVDGISHDGLCLEISQLAETAGLAAEFYGDTLSLKDISVDTVGKTKLYYEASGAANGSAANVIFPLKTTVLVNGETADVPVYEYRGHVLINLEYLNKAFGYNMFVMRGALPDNIGEPVWEINGTSVITAVNHKNINSFPADNGKTYISADDLQHCGFEVIYNGNDVEIKKPAVPLKNVPEDYDKPETYSYTNLKHIYDVYNGIYNVTVDGVKTDNVYIDSLLTCYAPCIAVEDLAAADGYTVEKTDGFINIYTK